MTNNIAFDAMTKVVDKGLEFMRNPNLNEEIFQVWLEYSQSVLKLVSSNPVILSNYLKVILATTNQNLQPHQKIAMCLKYLLSIMNLL